MDRKEKRKHQRRAHRQEAQRKQANQQLIQDTLRSYFRSLKQDIRAAG